MSVLPTALEFAKNGLARLEESKAYLPVAAKGRIHGASTCLV